MLYRRPGSPYWYTQVKYRGHTYRKSTRCKDKGNAEAFEAELRRRLECLANGSGHTFGDAAVRWLDEKQHKRSLDTDLMILEWFRPHLEHTPLTEITRERVDELRELKDGSHSTVNRYFALLRAILRIARDDWEWIDKAPKVPMYPKTDTVPRFLTWQQFTSLASELPPHLSAPAWFAASTGLRTRAIQSLQWDWIERDGVRFPPEVMKNAKWLTIPLAQTAWQVLAELYGSQRQGTGAAKYTFVTNAGTPWSGKFTTRAWRKACKRAGMPGVRFHDLRHSWASWHAQKGTRWK